MNKQIDRKVQNLKAVKESKIEKGLRRIVVDAGGACAKFESPGMPDRLCFLPGGRLYLVETKRPTGKLRLFQQVAHRGLKRLGFDVRTIYNEQELKQFENEISAV